MPNDFFQQARQNKYKNCDILSHISKLNMCAVYSPVLFFSIPPGYGKILFSAEASGAIAVSTGNRADTGTEYRGILLSA